MPSRSLSDRFWEKVDVKGPNDCWLWQGSKTGHGYGRIYKIDRTVPSHQVSWELYHNREFPEGMHGCHACDTPACVNPRHIWPGTRSQNIQDAKAKGRLFHPNKDSFVPANRIKTHCPKGHPFEGTNLYVNPNNGYRACVECRKAWYLERAPKRREARKQASTLRRALRDTPAAPETEKNEKGNTSE